jgi:5-hydroxyisourate hydrolase
MSWLTTHILDTSRGRPASGVLVVCERETNGQFVEVARGTTDPEGRLKNLFAASEPVRAGVHRLTFEVGSYFAALQESTMYPRVQIVFQTLVGEEHYHVPLLISPFGYSTYRGS